MRLFVCILVFAIVNFTCENVTIAENITRDNMEKVIEDSESAYSYFTLLERLIDYVNSTDELLIKISSAMFSNETAYYIKYIHYIKKLIYNYTDMRTHFNNRLIPRLDLDNRITTMYNEASDASKLEKLWNCILSNRNSFIYLLTYNMYMCKLKIYYWSILMTLEEIKQSE